jgi:SAM-dependent methyltransferase
VTADGFGTALRHRDADAHWLVQADGTRRRLPVERWHGPAEPATAAVVSRCAGPTLDLGCGPGRLTAALARAGLTTVGVDVSARAVALTRARGAVALQADLFDPLPAEGRWRHVVLLDGNIGIGGEPATLLERARELLAPGGAVLAELEPPGAPTGMTRVRLEAPGVVSEWFPWAHVSVDTVAEVAAEAGLEPDWTMRSGERWFTALRRP